MCLFRIAELSGGKILIDGINTSDLPLSKLRSAIEIVPQNPVLFKGPVRKYLDPHAEFPTIAGHPAFSVDFYDIAGIGVPAVAAEYEAAGHRMRRNHFNLFLSIHLRPDP